MFEYTYKVENKDIDIQNHVNNVVYVQYLQDAAVKHWEVLTKSKKFPEFTWVIARHEIDYIRPAFLGDELIIRTWVGKSNGTFSIRHVDIFKNEKKIVSAKTTWCLVDAHTFRPKNIPTEVMKLLVA